MSEQDCRIACIMLIDMNGAASSRTQPDYTANVQPAKRVLYDLYDHKYIEDSTDDAVT